MAKRNAYQREIRSSLGSVMREAREARGLSQLQFATRLEPGLHPTTVSGWETGEQVPRDRMFDIIVILGLPLQATAVLYLEALRERALDLETAGAASRRREGGPGQPRKR